MRRFLLFIALGFTSYAYGQQLSVDDLLQLNSVPAKRLDTYISKKGYVMAAKDLQNDTVIDTWQERITITDSTQQPVTRRLLKYQSGKETGFSLHTSSRDEYKTAVSTLKQEGFICATSTENLDTTVLFQKKNMTVQGYSLFDSEENLTLYCLYFREKEMPSLKSILYGEDLLQFTSHEYLSTFFGAKNVRKDLYYFSEKEINKCSVLFPNTPRQAVFIWEDEVNMTGLTHVIIGGSIPTAGSANFNKQIRENNWVLESGIRYNMKLDELIRLNGADLDFYGRNSEYYLSVVPQKKGEIDFATTGVILDCVNCAGAPVLDEKIISGSNAYDQNLNLHIGLLILTPQGSQKGKYASR